MNIIRRYLATNVLSVAVLCCSVQVGLAERTEITSEDFGLKVETLLERHTQQLFGVNRSLRKPAEDKDYVPRARAEAHERVKLADGLKAEFVARNVAFLGDMIALWPSAETPTHLIICIEQERSGITPGGNSGLNASVQHVNLRTGDVKTMLHGMSRCDGIRTTPWGTILATEEVSDGRAYEIIDPLNAAGHWIADRNAGDVRDAIDSHNPSRHVVQRRALPTVAWEGFTVLSSGVVILVDELRPGMSAADSDGGAIFKFLPNTPRTGDLPISTLSESPLASGTTYALSVSCVEPSSPDFPQYGQGCEVGIGAWVQVSPTSARTDAAARGATGYYRPEDLDRDPTFGGQGVRFCWANTGRSRANHFGEILCGVDATPLPKNPLTFEDPRTGFVYLTDGARTREAMTTATVNRFIEGDERFNAHDTVAFQPTTGNLSIVEDAKFGEVFACLPDGNDRDIISDGCVSIVSVTDPDAEPTGFIFEANGTSAYLMIQHGEQPDALLDFDSNPIDGRTDDLLKITGFAE